MNMAPLPALQSLKITIELIPGDDVVRTVPALVHVLLVPSSSFLQGEVYGVEHRDHFFSLYRGCISDFNVCRLFFILTYLYGRSMFCVQLHAVCPRHEWHRVIPIRHHESLHALHVQRPGLRRISRQLGQQVTFHRRRLAVPSPVFHEDIL
ncbi:hypothetical protein LAZ67_2000482 [Cordylochernes scorpioides]|uniref:Uncharacterized protein n=1 Tax=Cordylochernes scorpioides TaxID=51811 RepID=A0ABY6K5A4_9ARAC|nr:hypothetical protein LAZ67_2000482 [Cordylochernes scorpioides]